MGKPAHKKKRGKIVAGIAAAGAVAAGCLALPSAQAALMGGGGPQGRQADFADAAKEFHVPLDVLLGVSYQESLWEAHGGKYNTSGGYGPMNLTDVTAKMVSGGPAGAAGRGDLAKLTSDPSLHTLGAAAALTGTSKQLLRSDARQNIRGGAALLASYEKKLNGGKTPTDPSAWYGAVARYSQSPDTKSAGLFADRVYKSVKSGAGRRTQDGQSLKLAASPAVKPSTRQLSALHLKAAPADNATECPTTVDCTYLPADPSNGQAANRPSDGVDIKYLVIHDTESSYQAAIDTFQKAGGGDSAHYVMRASDGAVTQMTRAKDIAYHAGNYWFNLHSIGIEHEGFAAQGADWYPQTQYQATAELVKYLAAKYDIPLDRQHIIGHDNVPGPQDSYVAGMHWDPGPYWDWSRFMGMVGAHDATHTGRTPEVGSAVTIKPPFDGNTPALRVCPSDDPSGKTKACTDRKEPSSVLPVRTAPDASAPLFADPAVHPGKDGKDGKGTNEITDWGSTVADGQQFVVAGVSGDWTAIWFSGAKVWFYNPGGRNTVPAQGATIVRPTGDSAPLYGSGYPQASEYPSGLKPSEQKPFTVYAFPKGQAYVAAQPPVAADDYFATGDKHVTGAAKYWTIQYNHRVALVSSTDAK